MIHLKQYCEQWLRSRVEVSERYGLRMYPHECMQTSSGNGRGRACGDRSGSSGNNPDTAVLMEVG